MQDLEFRDIEKLVNYRLVTGQSGDISEFIEFAKIEILNSLENCIDRLFKLGYVAMEVNDNEDSTDCDCLKVEKNSIFNKQLELSKNRYISGESKDLKELFTVIKMIITQDTMHSARRLESEGYAIIVDPKYQTENETNNGNAFNDILGEVYDPSEKND